MAGCRGVVSLLLLGLLVTSPMNADAGALCMAIGTAAGYVAVGVGVPAAVVAVGFTPAGIVGGSYAATMMSAAAVANGGAVAAGSTVAMLQSIGAAGISSTVTASAAAVTGAFTSYFCPETRPKTEYFEDT